MKPLLFIDFDGTLCHDKFWRSLDVDTKEKVQDFLFLHSKNMVNDWMLGKYTSEEINQYISQKLNIDYDYLWSTFVKDCNEMRVEINDLLKIKELGAKFTTILMTDNMDCFTRFTAPSLNLEQYFNQIINSFDHKKSKNDHFRELLPADKKEGNVLIDNSANTCEVFKNLGGTSYLVTKKEPLSHFLTFLDTLASM